MAKNFKPYYAVIFTSLHNDKIEGYMEMANKMEELAQQQPGFLGIDSARTKIGITVSYWESLEDIKSWKLHTEQWKLKKKGKINGTNGIMLECAEWNESMNLIIPVNTLNPYICIFNITNNN